MSATLSSWLGDTKGLEMSFEKYCRSYGAFTDRNRWLFSQSRACRVKLEVGGHQSDCDPTRLSLAYRPASPSSPSSRSPTRTIAYDSQRPRGNFRRRITTARDPSSIPHPRPQANRRALCGGRSMKAGLCGSSASPIHFHRPLNSRRGKSGRYHQLRELSGHDSGAASTLETSRIKARQWLQSSSRGCRASRHSGFP